jgi:geranylgeranyl diphosphate synthase type II
MDFSLELQNRIKEIDGIIQTYLPKEEGFQKTVLSAMNYSILAGGKRIRPILILESYRLLGGKKEELVHPFLAAMEMIHTYSLVHDDLPAMDNDEYRRGRKTTHVVYGEAMGILAGDALLNYAFETACNAFDISENASLVGKALKILSVKPGIYGMLGGQAVDVESSEQSISKDKLDFIYRLKTGALIEGSMMIGAILAGASEQEIKTMEEIASYVGLAFQMQDDILDVTSTVEVLGKPINSDEKNHKTTYVTLMGIEQTKAEVEQYSKLAIEKLEGFNREDEFLKELIIYLINREN